MKLDGEIVITCPICPNYRSVVWKNGTPDEEDVRRMILAVHNSTPSHDLAQREYDEKNHAD